MLSSVDLLEQLPAQVLANGIPRVYVSPDGAAFVYDFVASWTGFQKVAPDKWVPFPVRPDTREWSALGEAQALNTHCPEKGAAGGGLSPPPAKPSDAEYLCSVCEGADPYDAELPNGGHAATCTWQAPKGDDDHDEVRAAAKAELIEELRRLRVPDSELQKMQAWPLVAIRSLRDERQAAEAENLAMTSSFCTDEEMGPDLAPGGSHD